MRVSDIWQEIIEATGTCDEQVNYRAITRAVELLANKGLFDPLLGTIDFTVDGGYLIALPRDVKTPLKLNINNNPAFSRNRLFEFAPNTEGGVDGPEVGWQWHERGYSPIQDERKLPSVLRYVVTNADDVGASLRVRGVDVDGYERDEIITGALTDATPTQFVYGEVRNVSRDKTTAEAYLYSETGAIARYYKDEEQPEYRVVKLSQTGVAVRMLYRRHVFSISSQDDIIPLHSAMAVIRAVDAVRLYQRKQYADAAIVLQEAANMIAEEQNTRDENSTIAGATELQSAINANINTNDVLIVADVYDIAADILGPIGRAKIFDRLTDAINVLSRKAQWDSLLGEAVLTRMAHADSPASGRCRGDGYFALPRYVGSVLAVNTNGEPCIPRNRWFEYHLNGTGDTKFASCGTWDDAGESVTINRLPSQSCKTVPTKLVAVANSALDAGKTVTVYGIERLEDGREVEVYRNSAPGWQLTVSASDAATPATDAPAFVRIDRITREATGDFVRLLGKPEGQTEDLLLGYWYPDEIEPRYRVIKVAGCCNSRIRIKYRKRTAKVSSLHDVINLGSRLAIENMLRALATQATDPTTAVTYEGLAVNYLSEEQTANNPVMSGGLQFDPGSSPGFNENIQ